jgi:hypothetical protein
MWHVKGTGVVHPVLMRKPEGKTPLGRHIYIYIDVSIILK